MNPAIWAMLHGASTHFPIALSVMAACCDGAAVVVWNRRSGVGLRIAGTIAVTFAAAGSVMAVISGLMMTRGEVLGRGALRVHHLAVWPVFALLIATAAWRLISRDPTSRRVHAIHTLVLCVAMAMTALAGYTGGELLQGLP